MKTALFTNFTEEAFTGSWDGKEKTFAPGKSLYMPDYLAKHFAVHLVNRELLRRKPDGNPVYKDGEKFVSPKHLDLDNPDEMKRVPTLFMDLFNKAFTPDDGEQMGDKKDDIDVLIKTANKNREKDASTGSASQADAPQASAPTPSQNPTQPPQQQNPNKPQVVLPPDFDEDDDDESSFGQGPSAAPTEAPKA